MASDGSLHFNTTLDTEGFEKGSQKMKDAISDLKDAVDDLGDSAKEVAALQTAQEEASRLTATLEQMAEAQQDLAIADLNPEQYQELQDALQQVAEQARAAREALEQVTNNNASNNPEYNAVHQQLSAVEQAATQAGTAIRRQFNMHHVLDGLRTGLVGLVQVLGTVAIAAGAVSVAFGVFAGRGIVTGVRLLSRAFVAVGNGIKTVVSRLRGLIFQTQGASMSMKGLVRELTSLKTMLISKVKGLFIKELTEGVSNGLKALIKYSSELDGSVSNMKNALTGLSSNISVAFANLINAVAPAITQIINWISTAITYLNAFFAMLTGKSTVTVAKQQTGSYAESLDKTAGSASKAADAQKKLNEQVYKFDELNKRADPTKNSSGGTDNPSYADLFEEKPIETLLPEGIKKYFDEIKKAFERGDWEGIGRIVARGLNEIVLAGDRWIAKNRPKIVGWAKDIADMLNGLVDGFNAFRLGSMVGNGLNAILDVINTFQTRFDNFRLGEKIAAALNGLDKAVDWKLLGATIAGGLNTIIQTFAGFTRELHWGSIGANIGKAIQSFTDTLDLSSAVEAVKHGVDGIATLINNLYTSVDWKGNARRLADKFGELFDGSDGINWYEVGRAVANGFNVVIETVSGFVGNPRNWVNVGTSLGTALRGVIENINGKELSEAISGLINGAFAGINAFLNTQNWYDIGADLMIWLQDTISAINWSEGDDSVAGTLAKGLNAAIQTTAGAIEEFEPHGITDGIKNFLSKGVSSIDWASIGEIIVLGILDGLQLITEGINDIMGGITNAFASLFDAMGLKFIGDWLREGIKNVQDVDKLLEKEFFMPLRTTIKTAFEKQRKEVSDETSETVNEVARGIGRNKSKVSKELNTASTSAKKTVNDTLDAINKDADSKLNTLVKTTESRGNDLKQKVSGAATNIQTKVSETMTGLDEKMYEDIATLTKTISDGGDSIQTETSSKLEELKRDISDDTKAIKDDIDGNLKDIEGSISTSTDTIKKTTSDTWDAVKTDTSENISAITDDATTQYGEMETELSSTMSTLKDSMSKGWSDIKSDTETKIGETTKTVKDTNWEGHGSNLVGGLLKGMQSKWGDVTSWTRASMKGLNSTVTTTLEINSPSRVWMWIGEMLMAGLEQGLDNSAGDVYDTVGDIAKNINDEAGNLENLKIDVNADRLAGALDIITEKLEAVSNAFRTVTTAFGDVLTPTVAYGMEVPYQARVSDVNPVVSNESADISGTLDDQTYVLKQIRGLLERMHLKVDGEDIVRGVSSAQRGIQRAYGGI